MKQLVIIRHAKSSWEDSSLKDFDRPLNDRGFHDAPLMAKVLKADQIVPDLTVSSPAKRALTTARFIAEGLDYPKDAIEEELSIYGASVEEMLQLINRLDDQHKTVFLFGHNPTFTALAEFLGDLNIGNLPTCGIVGLRFDLSDWQSVSGGTGTEFFYDYPKRHP